LKERSAEPARIEHAFLLAYGRPPTEEEARQVRSYLASVADGFRKAGVREPEQQARAWESFARVLFMSNEFVYVN
jgi:hypothetical protein